MCTYRECEKGADIPHLSSSSSSYPVKYNEEGKKYTYSQYMSLRMLEALPPQWGGGGVGGKKVTV